MFDTDVSEFSPGLAPPEPPRERPRPRQALIDVFPSYESLRLPRSDETPMLGRQWLCTHGIDDPLVSDHQVQVVRQPGMGMMIVDMQSAGGTWLNGQRLAAGQWVPMPDGSVLRIGGQVMVYRDEFVGRTGPDSPRHYDAPYGLRRIHEQITALFDRRLRHVLIEGETGTGRELLAREVASCFGRLRKSFLRVDCSGLSESGHGAELLGRVQGAYEGATTDEAGCFLTAQGGALLLDQIERLPLALQAKLVRALHERAVTPVGASHARPYDVAVIATSTRNLRLEVEQGRFREDLYHCLSEVHIELPPLRERKEDLPALLRGIVMGVPLAIDVKQMQPEAIERLLLHPWRGNMWELQQVLGEIAEVAPGPLTREAVDRVIGSLGAAATVRLPSDAELLRVYAECGESESSAARVLEMSVAGLRRRVRAAKPAPVSEAPG